MEPAYTLDELQDFINRYRTAETGEVDRAAALRWWQLGWVRQVAAGSNKWKPTENGRRLIEAPPN